MKKRREILEPVRQYESSGEFLYDDDKRLACDCLITQEHDGAITLECRTASTGKAFQYWTAQAFGGGPVPVEYQGTTSDGRIVRATGPFLCFPGDWSADDGAHCDHELTGKARLSVSSAGEERQPEYWRFALTNVFLPGDRLQNPTDVRRAMRLRLNDLTVILQSVADDSIVSSMLNSPGRVAVTAHAVLPGNFSFDEVSELASDLCSLLSIAGGCLVNWTHADAVALDETTCRSIHRSSITRAFNEGLPLIPRTSHDLQEFLESTFGPFVQSKETRHLREVALAMADMRTEGFLETRTLQMLSHVELIIGVDATLNNEATIVPNDLFEPMLGRLSRAVASVLKIAFPQSSHDQVQQMASHLRGFNYTTFKRRLRKTAGRLDIRMSNAEIESLHETRNALVHRGMFATPSPATEWAATLSVLDRC